MIWLAIAVFSLAYLAFLGMRPEVIASAEMSSAPDVREEIDGARRDMARAFADLDPMRRTMGEIKMDVANLKDAAQAAAHRDEMLLGRVVALETSTTHRSAHVAQTSGTDDGATGATSPTAAAQPTPPTPTPKAAVTSTSAKPAAPAQKVSAATPATKKKADSSIETGSIKKKKAAAKPAPVGVLLATGPSIDALRLNWSILTDRHSDAVGKLQPRYVINGSPGSRTYGLVLGPVASAKQAKSLCKTMVERGMRCEVSVYRGNAL